MKQIIVAKIANKSRGYVSEVFNGKRKDCYIEGLLKKTDYEQLYPLVGGEDMEIICADAAKKCESLQGRMLASKLHGVYKSFMVNGKELQEAYYSYIYSLLGDDSMPDICNAVLLKSKSISAKYHVAELHNFYQLLQRSK